MLGNRIEARAALIGFGACAMATETINPMTRKVNVKFERMKVMIVRINFGHAVSFFQCVISKS
jgi:hypothetical protein